MICKNYESLSHVDKIIYIGELVHSCQFDDSLFEMGKNIIELARQKGVLNGVVILPDYTPSNQEVCQEKQME